MGSLTQGAALRQRMKSRIMSGRIGGATPEEVLNFNLVPVAGAVDTILWVNPSDISAFKIVDVRERHVTPGTLPITLRLHTKGTVAAPGAAVAGSTIFDLVSIPTTTAANTWARLTKVGGVAGTITTPAVPAGQRLAAVPPGGTLIANVPATVALVALEIVGVFD
jgi:hypothetical protein